MTFNPDAATVYADGPSTEPYEPSKPQIRQLLAQYETIMNAFTTNAGLIYTTMAAMNAAATTFTEPRSAWQFEAGSEGVYVLNPTTDTWTKVGRLPYNWIPGTDLGAGTANAIQITTDTPVADGTVVMFSLFEATTASPVTISINGGAALTLKTNRGSNASALSAGMEIWGRYRASDSTFRLLNDQDVSTLVAQAEAARDAAIVAKVAAEAAAASALATVATYGGSAGADSSAAIAAMASALGFVRFGAGSTLVSVDITIDVPIEFQMGAYITVASTKTVTITNRIESPRQWIFRGAGLYVLGHDSDSGEDARQVHVSWFGAFPSTGTDQAPLIQAACTAMGNLRESVIEFDIGNYDVDSTITLTRGCHIKGQGTRRTVFRTDQDSFDMFVTGGIACRMTGIQFEIYNGLTVRTGGAYIRVQHEAFDLSDMFMQTAMYGIVLESGAVAPKIKDITAVYASNPGAGSSIVRVLGGGSATIDGVNIPTSSSFGPAAMVHVGGSGASTISGVSVSKTSGIAPSRHVHVEASAANITNVTLNGVRYSGFSGTAPAQAIKAETASTFSLDGLVIQDFLINGHAVAGITLEQNSTGSLENVVFSSGVIAGSSGNGIEFIRTAGTLSARVDASVDTTDRPTPFYYSGTITDVQISPLALPNHNAVATAFFTIADDSVATVDLHRSVFSGSVHITAGSARHGIFTVRAASSPTVSANRVTDANTVAVNTALTGTTGTDGNLTLGVQSGVLYVENRLGSSQSVSVTVMAS